jgi:dipeptidyl aminopeptidase/acylaminoacyl peptidase
MSDSIGSFDLDQAAATHDVRGVALPEDGEPVYARPVDSTYQLFRAGEQLTATDRGLSHPVRVLDHDAVVAVYHPEEGLGNSDVAWVSLTDGAVETLYDEPGQICFARPSPADPERIAFVHRGEGGSQVAAVDRDTGDVDSLVTDDDIEGWITAFAWSPAGEQLVVQAGVPGVSDALYRWDGDETTELLGFEDGAATLGGMEAGLLGLAPGQRFWSEAGILFAGGSDDTADLGVVQSDGEYEWLVESDAPIVPVEWVAPGEALDAAYIEKAPGKSHLKRVQDGETATLTDRGVVDIVRFSDVGERCAFVRKDYDSAGDLWVDGEKQTTVGTCESAECRPVALTYEGHDGVEIPALCYAPDPDSVTEDGIADADGPALVYAHGGVDTRNEEAFSLTEQAFAAAGYTVLAPDYRGSGGHGRSFLHANDGEMGVVDLDDIVAGARFLRERGFESVGVYGESWGGYFTLSAVSRRDAFDAGAAICPATDLQRAAADGKLSIAATKFGVEGEGGDSAVLGERSPISHVDSVSVPIQLFHGDADSSVSVEHTHAFTEELDAAGVDYDVTIYEGEDHIIQKPKNRVGMVRTMRSFFADALGE